MSRTRVSAAERKVDERRRVFEEDLGTAMSQLGQLQSDQQELERQLAENRDAQHQMIGRVRYIQERLGQAPRMMPAGQEASGESAAAVAGRSDDPAHANGDAGLDGERVAAGVADAGDEPGSIGGGAEGDRAGADGGSEPSG